MAKKIIVLAPSAGGKSTLMNYLRDSTDLPIFEMDEEVMLANHDEWPSDNEYKDGVLVPKIVKSIVEKSNAVYLTSYVPEELLRLARRKDFKIILINVFLTELIKRNKNRMKMESYADATLWLQLQLDTFKKLTKKV